MFDKPRTSLLLLSSLTGMSLVLAQRPQPTFPNHPQPAGQPTHISPAPTGSRWSMPADLPVNIASNLVPLGPVNVKVNGLQFTTDTRTHLNLQQGRTQGLRITGPITLRTVLQLHSPPAGKQALISKWRTEPGGRSYELGINKSRRVFLAISATGNYDAYARELLSTHSLEVGVPFAISARFSPGLRMALSINGHPSGELTNNLPDRIHDNETQVWLGGRPPGGFHIKAFLGNTAVFNRALTDAEIRKWAAALDLTRKPSPAPLSFMETLQASQTDKITIRPITRGPKSHWFGYYDKFQFDPTERYVLGMEIDFEHRSPKPNDVIKVGMVDLENDDRWLELGETRAWGWQQGCMLQWRPGTNTEILWNDRDGDSFVCHLLDVRSGRKRTLFHPVYHVSPDGKWGLGLDFARLNEMDPGYGYQGLPDRNRSQPAPDGSTLFIQNLDTGERRDIISVADIARIPYQDSHPEDKHYFNHIQWRPDGNRFLFLNRWLAHGRRRGGTRMFTLNPDGSVLRLVNLDSSHFEWRDRNHILIWVNNAYRLFPDDGSVGPGKVVWKAPNGHQSYLPGKEWLITDTYPLGKEREQHVYLHHVTSRRHVLLGSFPVPPEYKGEWRCDTHPRISRHGTKVVFDSPHGGNGRQMYLIDIEAIVRP